MIGSNLKKVRSTSTTNEIHFYDGGNLKIDSFEDFPRLINLHIHISNTAIQAHSRIKFKEISKLFTQFIIL